MHFCSVIMEICISGVTAVFGITHMRWLHHQCELGGDSSTLHYFVSCFPRKLPVNIRHQTSYLSHVFRAVCIESQFDISQSWNKWIKVSYICSKLNEGFQIFRSSGKYQAHIHKAQLVTCWELLIDFGLNILCLHLSRTQTRSNLFNVRIM